MSFLFAKTEFLSFSTITYLKWAIGQLGYQIFRFFNIFVNILLILR